MKIWSDPCRLRDVKHCLKKGCLKNYVVCTLCIAQDRWDIVNVKNIGRPINNLPNNLDSDERPGYRERHNLYYGI